MIALNSTGGGPSNNACRVEGNYRLQILMSDPAAITRVGLGAIIAFKSL